MGEEFSIVCVLPNRRKGGFVSVTWFVGQVVILGGLRLDMERDNLGFPLRCSQPR